LKIKDGDAEVKKKLPHCGGWLGGVIGAVDIPYFLLDFKLLARPDPQILAALFTNKQFSFIYL
jgi:hypothetical protein